MMFAMLKILQSDYISRSSRFFSWFLRYLALVDLSTVLVKLAVPNLFSKLCPKLCSCQNYAAFFKIWFQK